MIDESDNGPPYQRGGSQWWMSHLNPANKGQQNLKAPVCQCCHGTGLVAREGQSSGLRDCAVCFGSGQYPDSEKSVATQTQPAPKTTESPDCWLLVMADMEERRQFGINKYGTPVRHDSGRDPLVDAYQEVLDLAVYLRAEIEKRRAWQRLDQRVCDLTGMPKREAADGKG